MHASPALQGFAADACKRAMLAIHRRLAALPPGAAAMVLQVHDEILLEVQQHRLQEVRLEPGAWAPTEAGSVAWRLVHHQA